MKKKVKHLDVAVVSDKKGNPFIIAHSIVTGEKKKVKTKI